MFLLGLTGSISTGKSTVSALLNSPPYNLPIIDADLIARTATDPASPTYSRIVSHFLPTTPDLLLPPDPDTGKQHINRAALGRKVFGPSDEHKKERDVLNKIIHPYVRREIYKLVIKHWIKGHWCAVLDVPLLFESGLDVLCGGVLLVGISDHEVQIRRLLERDSKENEGTLTREEAVRRIDSQMSIREKCERIGKGGYWPYDRAAIVWNDGSKEELKEEVAGVIEKFGKARRGIWNAVEWLVWPWTMVRVVWVVMGNLWRRRKWLDKRKRGLGKGDKEEVDEERKEMEGGTNKPNYME